MIASHLRRLERAIPCFRAQAAFSPIAEEYADQCQYAIERNTRFPDFLEFVRTSPRPHLPSLASGSALRYAEQCDKNRTVPRPGYLTHYYVHGYAMAHRLHHPKPKYRCRCGTPLDIHPGTSYTW